MITNLFLNQDFIFSPPKNADTDISLHINKVKASLQLLAELKTKIGNLPSNALISEYNTLSNTFNTNVAEINQIESLKTNIELKNKIIAAHNRSLNFVDQIQKQISGFNKKNTNPKNSEDYLIQYAEIKTEPLRHLNSPTFQFFCLLAIFSITSLLSFVFNYLWQNQIQAEVFDVDAKLKTFTSVIDNMSEGVVVTNPNGFFTYYNQAALDIIGTEVKDVHYPSSIDLLGFYNSEQQKINKNKILFYSALKKETLTDQEIFVQNNRNPEGIYISASSGFFSNQRGETAGSVVVMKNVTHKKDLEKLWLKEKESAIEGSRKKSDFLASMSHEIRTPMNGIIGLTTLLKETSLNCEQRDYVGTVQRSAQSLLSLINDILDHSKIEAGKVDLISANFNLKLLIKDICENFKFICAEKNIQMVCHYPESAGEYYLADANRLRQILMNLIGNAVKFTTQGAVELKLNINTARQKIKFEITDTGTGMEPHEVERLFQRFFQTKSGIKFGGTGLGLSISKQLVDLMQGEIGVSSIANVGSTFWFEISMPVGTQPAHENQLLTLANLENIFKGKILVAEDNIVNQKVVSQYLKKLGFTVDIANNGAEAVSLFQTEKYDLIFMDCQMPVMTGYQATQNILQLQSNRSNCVPIVALTAEGTSGEKAKCFAAGMNDFLNKPLIFEQLATLLFKYFKSAPIQIDGQQDQKKYKNNLEIYKLAEIKVGEQLLLEILFEDYQSSARQLIDAMKSALQTDNKSEISEAAHTLKSASATLSAMAVSEICQKLENLSTDTENSNYEPLLIQLEIEYTKSIGDVQKIIFEIQHQQKASA